MATYDNSGSTGGPFGLENRYYANRFTIGAAGEILTNVRCWLNESSTNNAHPMKPILVRSSDSALIAVGTERQDIQTGAAAPYDFTFASPPVLSNIAYEIGLFVGAGAGNLSWDADNATGTFYLMIVAGYPTTTDPAVWSPTTGTLRMIVTTTDPSSGTVNLLAGKFGSLLAGKL